MYIALIFLRIGICEIRTLSQTLRDDHHKAVRDDSIVCIAGIQQDNCDN